MKVCVQGFVVNFGLILVMLFHALGGVDVVPPRVGRCGM